MHGAMSAFLFGYGFSGGSRARVADIGGQTDPTDDDEDEDDPNTGSQ